MDLVGLSSFNELPLAVPQPAYPCLGGELSPSSSGEGSPGAVPVARLPRHALPRRHASDVELLARPSGPLGALARPPAGGVTEAGAGGEVPSRSELESTLVALWEDRADRGLFRWVPVRDWTRAGRWGSGVWEGTGAVGFVVDGSWCRVPVVKLLRPAAA